MCRFCKKLRDINDLREKNLRDCIESWKRRDKEAQCLLGEALDILDPVWNDTGFDVYEACLDIADLTFRIKQFLQRDWIRD